MKSGISTLQNLSPTVHTVYDTLYVETMNHSTTVHSTVQYEYYHTALLCLNQFYQFYSLRTYCIILYYMIKQYAVTRLTSQNTCLSSFVLYLRQKGLVYVMGCSVVYDSVEIPLWNLQFCIAQQQRCYPENFSIKSNPHVQYSTVCHTGYDLSQWG